MLEPDKRLGSDEMGGFEKLKGHPFFEGIDWENLENLKPPELVPYLPATSSNPESCWSTMKVSMLSCREEQQRWECLIVGITRKVGGWVGVLSLMM